MSDGLPLKAICAVIFTVQWLNTITQTDKISMEIMKLFSKAQPNVKFQFIIVVNMKMTALWDTIMACS
jgi:hypothetical protein